MSDGRQAGYFGPVDAIMLQSIKLLCGTKLDASDGEIGQVKDLYFDSQKLAVRYVLADTGNWLPGRQVLLSPHAFADIQPAEKAMLAILTRKQIADGPAIDTHKTVSRQYEEEYHRYYGWPYYWKGAGLWGGTRGFPILEVPYDFFPGMPSAADAHPDGANSDLHSTQAVTGYRIQATDGISGHVCDFLMDAKSWAVTYLVVKTGHRLTGKETRIPMGQLGRISRVEFTIHVNLSKETLERSPAHQWNPNAAATSLEPDYTA
jgi:hypothetical protein